MFLGYAYILYLSDEEESAEDTMYRKTITLEMTGEGYNNSAMDVLPEYSMDAHIVEDYDRIRAFTAFVNFT